MRLSVVSAAVVAMSFVWILPTPCEAQGYPSRQINFLVPNLPGGSSDSIARAIGAGLQKSTGAVVIDNKPGASEMIATELLSRATPDGYTIAIFS